MTVRSAQYGASGLGNRGLAQPNSYRTIEQVERRYQLMQELRKGIEDYNNIIKQHELIISQAQDEILKKQEILDNLSRGENIPGETY